MDLKIIDLEKRGKLVPTRDMIKTPEQIEGIRKAGAVNTGCLDAVEAAIHPGMNTQEIDDICMQYCKEHHAHPSCLNYEDSLNTAAPASTKWCATAFPRKKMCCSPVIL